MSETCPFCGLSVNPFDVSTWKEVTGWVGGVKKDSMRLRVDTGRYAHTHCIGKQMQGQAPDQADLLGEDQPATSAPVKNYNDIEIDEVLGGE